LSQKLRWNFSSKLWGEVAPNFDSRFGGIKATAYSHSMQHAGASIQPIWAFDLKTIRLVVQEPKLL